MERQRACETVTLRRAWCGWMRGKRACGAEHAWRLHRRHCRSTRQSLVTGSGHANNSTLRTLATADSKAASSTHATQSAERQRMAQGNLRTMLRLDGASSFASLSVLPGCFYVNLGGVCPFHRVGPFITRCNALAASCTCNARTNYPLGEPKKKKFNKLS